jgi:hypothetical protein
MFIIPMFRLGFRNYPDVFLFLPSTIAPLSRVQQGGGADCGKCDGINITSALVGAELFST